MALIKVNLRERYLNTKSFTFNLGKATRTVTQTTLYKYV